MGSGKIYEHIVTKEMKTAYNHMKYAQTHSGTADKNYRKPQFLIYHIGKIPKVWQGFGNS